MRYALTGPVEHGVQWWEINDLELEMPVATFSVRLPDAEREARDLFTRLTGRERRVVLCYHDGRDYPR